MTFGSPCLFAILGVSVPPPYGHQEHSAEAITGNVRALPVSAPIFANRVMGLYQGSYFTVLMCRIHANSISRCCTE